VEYQIEVTVPANTLQASPVHEQLGLSYGIVTSYRLIIPPGCAGLVRFNVWYHSQQVLPMTADTAFIGDDYASDMPCYIELFEKPFVLDVYAWSPGSSYDHTVYLSFTVEVPTVSVHVPLYSQETVELPGEAE